MYWHNILHPVSHRAPHTHVRKRGMNPWGIYGGVRFVDLGTLLTRTHIFLLRLPLHPPLTLHNPTFFLSCWPRFNRTPVDSQGGERSLWDSYISQYGIKKKRHTLNFLASILTRISPVDDTSRVSNMPVWFRAHERSVSEYSRICLFSLQPAACSLKWILRDSWNQSP